MNRQRITERVRVALSEVKAEAAMCRGVVTLAKEGGYAGSYVALKQSEVGKLDAMIEHLDAALTLAKDL